MALKAPTTALNSARARVLETRPGVRAPGAPLLSWGTASRITDSGRQVPI